MPSIPIYERTLTDGREISVIEWESRGRVFREVFVFMPAPPESDPALVPDDGIVIGPRSPSRIQEIVDKLRVLCLPDDVSTETTAALRSGRLRQS